MSEEYLNKVLEAFNNYSNYLNSENLSIEIINSYFEYFISVLGVKVDYSSLNKNEINTLDREDILFYCSNQIELLCQIELSDEQRCAIYVCSILVDNKEMVPCLHAGGVFEQVKDDDYFKKVFDYFLNTGTEFDEIEQIKSKLLKCIHNKYHSSSDNQIFNKFNLIFENDEKYIAAKKKKQLEEQNPNHFIYEQDILYKKCIVYCDDFLNFKNLISSICFLDNNLKNIVDDNKKFDIINKYISKVFNYFYNLESLDYKKIYSLINVECDYFSLLINNVSDFNLKMSLIEYYYDTRSKIIDSNISNDKEKEDLYKLLTKNKYNFDVSSYPLDYIKYLYSKKELMILKNSIVFSSFYDKYKEFVDQNLELFLREYGFKNIENKIDYLKKMMSFDESIFTSLKLEMLDERYTSIFTPYQLCIIINLQNFDIMMNIEDFSQNSLLFIKKLIEKYEFSNAFNYCIETIALNVKQYESFLDTIDFSKIDDETLFEVIKQVSFENDLNLQSIEDINNIPAIMDNEFKIAYEKNDKEKMINLLFLKKFGINVEMAKILSSFKPLKYKDIDEIMNLLDKTSNSNFKYFLGSFLLEEYSSLKTFHHLVDKIMLKKYLINEIEDEYNKELFNIENGKKVKEKDGIQFYEPENEFYILMTAISPYVTNGEKIKPENIANSWNRKDISSGFFCSSLISDEMLGCAKGQSSLYLGFSSIEPDTIVDMGSNDISSGSAGINKIGSQKCDFYKPEDLIHDTASSTARPYDLYNEIDVRRFFGEQKKQPDFIIQFINCENEVPEDVVMAASKSFGNIPIVVIDVEKYLKRGIEKINMATRDYNENPTMDNLEKIWSIFRKTSLTFSRWGNIKLDFRTMVDIPDILRKKIGKSNIGKYELLGSLDVVEQKIV